MNYSLSPLHQKTIYLCRSMCSEKKYENNREYYIVLLGENGYPTFQYKIKNNVKNMLIDRLNEMGIKSDFELEYTIEFILSAMLSVFTYWFQQKDAPPSTELLELMYKLTNQSVLKKFSELL